MEQSTTPNLPSALTLLTNHLLIFVKESLKNKYGSSWESEVIDILYKGKEHKPSRIKWHKFRLFEVIFAFWQPLFSKKLEKQEIFSVYSMFQEIRRISQVIDSSSPINDEDSERALDTIDRLLKAICVTNAGEYSERLEGMRKVILIRLYGSFKCSTNANNPKNYVSDALDILSSHLAPFLKSTLIQKYGEDKWQATIQEKYNNVVFNSTGVLHPDPYALLKIIKLFRYEFNDGIFIGQQLAIVKDLYDIRNHTSHGNKIALRDADRVLDSTLHLMREFDHPDIEESIVQLIDMRKEIIGHVFVDTETTLHSEPEPEPEPEEEPEGEGEVQADADRQCIPKKNLEVNGLAHLYIPITEAPPISVCRVFSRPKSFGNPMHISHRDRNEAIFPSSNNSDYIVTTVLAKIYPEKFNIDIGGITLQCLSDEVDGGNSFHLGALIACALRLDSDRSFISSPEDQDKLTEIIWATGEINFDTPWNILPVDSIAKKIENSMSVFIAAMERKIPIKIFIPGDNNQEVINIKAALSDAQIPHGAYEIYTPRNIEEVYGYLELEWPLNGSNEDVQDKESQTRNTKKRVSAIAACVALILVSLASFYGSVEPVVHPVLLTLNTDYSLFEAARGRGVRGLCPPTGSPNKRYYSEVATSTQKGYREINLKGLCRLRAMSVKQGAHTLDGLKWAALMVEEETGIIIAEDRGMGNRPQLKISKVQNLSPGVYSLLLLATNGELDEHLTVLSDELTQGKLGNPVHIFEDTSNVSITSSQYNFVL
jgi:hypothetical protein